MKNKLIIIILGVLFVIFLFLTIIGFLNRNNETELIAPDYPSSIQKITNSNETKDIESFTTIIESFDFYQANKEFESSHIKGIIKDGKVTIHISKDAINNPSEKTTNVITYTITDIDSPIAAKAQILSDENNSVSVYTKDKYGRLLLSTFYAKPEAHTGITTTVFDIKKVVSFSVISVPLTSNNTTEQIYTIFKTKDGTYYTDYMFDSESERKIYKINPIKPAE